MQTTTPEYSYKTAQPGHHHQYLAQAILSLLPNPASSPDAPLRVLDLGCGNGSFSHFIANQGFNVTGVEDSASGIALAKQTYSDCCFFQGSIYDLDLPQHYHSFDVVLAVEVIEHLFYPKELARVAKRYLRPGGTLVITTPYHGYLKNLTMAVIGKLDRHFTVLWDGGHIKFFSVPTLRQLVLDEGFANPQFKFAGRFPYLWKGMVCASTLPPSAKAS